MTILEKLFDDVNILFSFIKDSTYSQNKIPLNIPSDASWQLFICKILNGGH